MIFGKKTINDIVKTDIAVSDKMLAEIDLWCDMYSNPPLKSLGLPAAIAAETARTATIEFSSVISGSARAEFLNAQYQAVIEDMRRYAEYALAKGGLVFKPYIDGGKIIIDYVQADCFFPTKFNSSGKITAAVFVGRIIKGEKYYTRLEIHDLTGSVYTVTNKAYRSDNRSYLGAPVPLSSVPEWADLAEEAVIENVQYPLFAYLKMPFANTIDPQSPMGVSIYSRAVDLIREADKQYERLLWEFESGERALYVDDAAFRRDEKGRAILPDKRLYKAINQEDLFKDWSPDFREQSILNGLNKILQRVEFSVGLAYGTISDPQEVDKTAEEIKSSKQRSYVTVCDIQKAIKNALTDLVYAMDTYCSLYKLAPVGRYEMSFDFDDSVMADRKTEFAEKQALVSMGVMQPWEFRMWYTGEDEATARAMAGGNIAEDEE